MFSKNWKTEIFTFPNFLSLFRIILIPLYITIYHGATNIWHHYIAGGILTLSCLTDMADGIIARKYNRITTVGKLLDPLADKLTQFALFLTLSVKYKLLYPVLVLFLVKEVFQCAALIYFAQKGKSLQGALFAGKICTAVLFFTFILLVFFPSISPGIVSFMIITDTCFLMYSFWQYISAYIVYQNFLTDWERN